MQPVQRGLQCSEALLVSLQVGERLLLGLLVSAVLSKHSVGHLHRIICLLVHAAGKSDVHGAPSLSDTEQASYWYIASHQAAYCCCTDMQTQTACTCGAGGGPGRSRRR